MHNNVLSSLVFPDFRILVVHFCYHLLTGGNIQNVLYPDYPHNRPLLLNIQGSGYHPQILRRELGGNLSIASPWPCHCVEHVGHPSPPSLNFLFWSLVSNPRHPPCVLRLGKPAPSAGLERGKCCGMHIALGWASRDDAQWGELKAWVPKLQIWVTHRLTSYSRAPQG